MSEMDSVSIESADSEYLSKLQNIPQKMGFKIGEVAQILGVKQYVLRYWETEFEELSPKKSSNKQRMYSRKNVETALLIQKLLHRDRFSIEGARKWLKQNKDRNKLNQPKSEPEMKTHIQDLSDIKRQLLHLQSQILILQERFKT